MIQKVPTIDPAVGQDWQPARAGEQWPHLVMKTRSVAVGKLTMGGATAEGSVWEACSGTHTSTPPSIKWQVDNQRGNN